jgi:DnaJ-class molecular chaperone
MSKKPGDEVSPESPQSGDAICADCGGTGKIKDQGKDKECPECSGSGKITALVGDA